MDGVKNSASDSSQNESNVLKLAQESLVFWTKTDLVSKKKGLDSAALSIAEHVERSANSRKSLAFFTKEFRKQSDQDKLANFPKLLKQYQEEVDNLTKRSVAAEASYLDLYQTVRDAPDPCAAFRAVVEDERRFSSIADIQKQNESMRSKLLEYEREFSQLKNQEVTVRRLEGQLAAAQSQIKEQVQREVELKRMELGKQQDELTDKYKQMGQLLQEQLRQAQEENERLSLNLEKAQHELFQYTNGQNEAIASQQRQLDMLNDEVASLQSTNSVLENEKNTLLEKLRTGSGAVDGVADGEFERTRSELLITELRSKVEQLESQIQKKNDTVDELSKQVTELKNQAGVLDAELQARPTHEAFRELRQRLRTIEDLEFSFERDESARTTKSVEQLLVEKNRHMQSEVTSMRVALQEKERALAETSDMLERLRDQAKNQADLIQRLEEDLASVRADARDDNSDNVSVITTTSELSNITGLTALASQSTQGAESGGENSHLMVRVLAQQRNRYKKRLQEAEEQNQQLQQKVQQLQTEVRKLNSENLKLYERIRYLESYSAQDSASSTQIPIAAMAKRKDVSDDLEDPSNKYQQIYEANLSEEVNPLAKFQRKEKSEYLRSLNIAERVALQTSGLMLSSKYGRIFIFWYNVLLHIFVFCIMYYMFESAHSTNAAHGPMRDVQRT